MNLEHPIITEINRYGYPKEYLQYDRDWEEDDDGEDQKKKPTRQCGLIKTKAIPF